MKIIPGPASKELGEKIAQILNLETVPVNSKTFPDGESYIRYETESLKDEDVVIVQTTSPPQDQRLIQLFLMADNALDMGAKSITVVAPYLAYSRQDKRFMTGEAFSIKTIIKLLENCGVKRIITVNAHSPAVLKTLKIQVEDLSAVALLAHYFKEKGLVENPLALSLGKKAISMATEADNVLKGGFDYISTKRDVVSGNVTLEDKPLPVKNRDVVIFDDIISSGGTMAKAVKYVKSQGARKVYAACVHPLLIGDAQKRIMENGADDIVGTDSIPTHVSKVSLAPLISKALKEHKSG
ncbi:MAG: ribose-phosphate diphosphokinase [Candidatus Bathyarchaeia archaeon]|nr:MAG: ribose-phosphate pyrophosphokinase [Candidatus Bathyarchaeota archaeon]